MWCWLPVSNESDDVWLTGKDWAGDMVDDQMGNSGRLTGPSRRWPPLLILLNSDLDIDAVLLWPVVVALLCSE
jgi:hypothetical protein